MTASLATLDRAALECVTGGRLVHGRQMEQALLQTVNTVAQAAVALGQQKQAGMQGFGQQALQAAIQLRMPQPGPPPGGPPSGQGGGGYDPSQGGPGGPGQGG